MALVHPAFSDWVRATLEQRHPPLPVEALPGADAIVVLGGGMEAARPPERLYPDLNAAADRVWHAARLFRAGKAPLILASGGNLPWSGAERAEAEVMAELLQELGVPKAAIVLEARSRTTQENRDNSLPVLHQLGAHRILLVTSALHMPRALALFAATDLAVVPAPTDFEVRQRAWNLCVGCPTPKHSPTAAGRSRNTWADLPITCFSPTCGNRPPPVADRLAHPFVSFFSARDGLQTARRPGRPASPQCNSD